MFALAFAGVGVAAPSGSTDLGITKADSPDPVGVGSTLTYTIRVQNLGPDLATGVTVTDQVPKGVDFVSPTTSSGQCARKGKKISCVSAGSVRRRPLPWRCRRGLDQRVRALDLRRHRAADAGDQVSAVAAASGRESRPHQRD